MVVMNRIIFCNFAIENRWPDAAKLQQKWKRLKWAIWGPMKIKNGRNETFEAQRKLKMAEMKDLSPNEK